MEGSRGGEGNASAQVQMALKEHNPHLAIAVDSSQHCYYSRFPVGGSRLIIRLSATAEQVDRLSVLLSLGADQSRLCVYRNAYRRQQRLG